MARLHDGYAHSKPVRGGLKRASTSHRRVTLLSLIFLLAFALRVADIGRQSLWYDEGVSAYLTTLSLPEITRWTADDIQPPLYYYGLAGWAALAGRSEMALRFFSLIFSLLTVSLAWDAGRRLFSERAGLLAALLFAASPLHIWYAQEARNYAMLTFWGLLASCIWLRLLDRIESDRPTGMAPASGAEIFLWAAYVAVAVAALYTHYFAIFLLTFHAFYFLGRWWTAGRPGAFLRRAAIAGVVILISYLPWLPAMLGRYEQDTSYWAGALKVGEALRKVLISFSLGESVLEPVGFRLGIIFLGILGVSWLLLGLAGGRRGRRALLFLALYLLMPIVAILLLALRAPKFNPRYLMPASPAFLLSLAGGLDLLGRVRTLPWRIGSRLMAGVALCFILGGFAYADRNIFADPAFTKADFRGVAGYLRAHRQPDEVIILLSGHMYPVFEYYMPAANVIRLPAARTLSTELVLNYFEVATELTEALAGKAGVWVVRWQDEVVDPNGVVALALDSAAQRQPVDASFWHVGLDHYRLPAEARFAPGAQIAHDARVNFGGLIELVGWSQPAPDEYVLYWQALRPIATDLIASLRLVDIHGLLAGQEDRRPAAYLYPTMRWTRGVIVPGRGRLPTQPGMPPGTYSLEVRVYPAGSLTALDILDAAGAPQGQSATLGPFVLQDAGRTWREDNIPIVRRLDHVWFDSISLRGVGALPTSVMTGEALTVETVWSRLRAGGPALCAAIRLTPAGRNAPRLESDLRLMIDYPTEHWQVGEWLRGRAVLPIPADWPAGPADLALAVWPADGLLVESAVPLGSIVVIAPPREYQAPALMWPVGADAGDSIRLLGFDVTPPQPNAGAPASVTLYWQPLRLIPVRYTVFVHLVDANGRILDQIDRMPANGMRPTTSWLPGEIITDRYDFARWPAGATALSIGLYDASRPGMPRLTWRSMTGQPQGQEIQHPLTAAR